MRIYEDLQLGVAVLVAPIYWALLYFFNDWETAHKWSAAYLWVYISISVLYPVLEEIVFRGGLQPWLRKFMWGRRCYAGVTLANIVASVVFAVTHVVLRVSPWALLVILPSLVFGYFRDRHDSLAPPILLHVFYNSGYFFLFGV